MGKEVQQQIALNLLSEGTQITGDLHASNDIRIDGELKGKIFTKGRLVIGQMAKVEVLMVVTLSGTRKNVMPLQSKNAY